MLSGKLPLGIQDHREESQTVLQKPEQQLHCAYCGHKVQHYLCCSKRFWPPFILLLPCRSWAWTSVIHQAATWVETSRMYTGFCSARHKTANILTVNASFELDHLPRLPWASKGKCQGVLQKAGVFISKGKKLFCVGMNWFFFLFKWNA